MDTEMSDESNKDLNTKLYMLRKELNEIKTTVYGREKTLIELSECQTGHNRKIEDNYHTLEDHQVKFKSSDIHSAGIQASVKSVDKNLGSKISRIETRCNEFNETLKYLVDKCKDHSRWEFTKADLSFVNMLQEKIKSDVPNVVDYTKFKD